MREALQKEVHRAIDLLILMLENAGYYFDEDKYINDTKAARCAFIACRLSSKTAIAIFGVAARYIELPPLRAYLSSLCSYDFASRNLAC